MWTAAAFALGAQAELCGTTESASADPWSVTFGAGALLILFFGLRTRLSRRIPMPASPLGLCRTIRDQA